MLIFKKKNPIRFAILLAVLTVATQTSAADTFDIVSRTRKVSIVYATDETKLDSISANLLANDIELVSGYRPRVTGNIATVNGNVIIIGSINSQLIKSFNDSYFKQLDGKWECYSHKVLKQPFKNIQQALIIAGSDARGTAYGVFSLSEKIGVSPWYWWADVTPERKAVISIDLKDFTSITPSVKYRGIFINDEDWGLQPWAAKTFEPEIGDIGPKTYAKIFELLLRLKANLIWPAMHPSTKAFFSYPGNVTTAEEYQIVVGSSHAEPMLRNNVGEWNEKTMGHFNYLTNKNTVYKYWEDRVKESSRISASYSLGMRGVHDSGLEGIKDPKEAVPLVERIFEDQRGMLARYVNKDVTKIPQVLTVYKEVLDIYDKGLKVPEDVTLVWPDDNYGYIQRLNNVTEQRRSGGSGVYYHASYWGRPHDYLWLSSTHPSLIREEMMKAYETGANNVWVLNVGDIKPSEYNIELFMDMAYNALPFKNSTYIKQHMLHWSSHIFGEKNAGIIQPILWKYYQLAFERKPEFMGWSQTEPETKTTFTDYNHFFYGDEAQKRIDQYETLEKNVKGLRSKIDITRRDAYYQLIYYPVLCASLMNKKFLYRDKSYLYAKQNRLSSFDYALWSKQAYDSIIEETEFYNNQLARGKWKFMMSMKPRNLAVYLAPVLTDVFINKTEKWNLAPEGFVKKDSSLVSNANAMLLPSFDATHHQKYFIDIFICNDQPVKWTAAPSNDWIRLSTRSGSMSKEEGKKQVRIWVDIDWPRLAGVESSKGSITFVGEGKQVVVDVNVLNSGKNKPPGYTGFVENNGYVSMFAADFTRKINRQAKWEVVDNLGYTGKVMQALPFGGNPDTLPHAIEQNNALLEYEFYTISSDSPTVHIFSLPTHPLNNNYSMRYAVSIDDNPLQVINFRTYGRSEEWKQNVLRNRAERKINMPFLPAGKHTLKLFSVDPGVILDEISIDLGGLKKAYGTITETK